MKYETPELVALNAINSVQSQDTKKVEKTFRDALGRNENVMGYADWE